MSSIGPDLPPHLLKRKHGDEADEPDSRSSTPDDASSKKRRVAGPAPPPPHSDTPPRRVMGPAPPPASLDERPSQSPSGGAHPVVDPHDANDSSDSSSDDDGYGPALPSSNAPQTSSHQPDPADSQRQPAEKKRDDWMLAPPDSSSSLAHRMDPTKRQPRGFSTGKSARKGDAGGGSGELSALWTETPEQKKKRLADEVLGVSSRASEGKSTQTDDERARERSKRERDKHVAQRVKEYDSQYRSKSLYQEHQDRAAREPKEKDREDDPSRRAWDYEKDMNGGRKIGYSQRQEMLKKASGFGSRFTKGSYS